MRSRTGSISRVAGIRIAPIWLLCALCGGPALSAQDQARTLVCAGADDLVGDETDTPGFDDYYGWGRLNAYNSVILAQTHIDQVVTLANGDLMLSWESPPNAGQRQPYRVDYSTSPNRPWTTLTNSNGFVYSSNRTEWIDDGSVTGTYDPALPRFYRVHIWQP